MKPYDDRIYTLEIGARAVLCFPAANHTEAQSFLKEEWLRADLRALKSGGVPLWDGKQRPNVRIATPTEGAKYDRESRDLPGDNDDLPIVYLVRLY